jgi:hypothetical protein
MGFLSLPSLYLRPIILGSAVEEHADRVDDRLGLVGDLTPGAADDIPAGDLEPLISAAILLEGSHGPVRLAAVGFDDQSGLAPKEIRFDSCAPKEEGSVHLWRGKVGRPAE